MPLLATLALHGAVAGAFGLAPSYTVTTINGLSDQAETSAGGINNRGEIVGLDGATQALDCGSSAEDKAFTDIGGVITETLPDGSCYGAAFGVTESGTIVGFLTPPGNGISGYIETSSGSITTVDYPGAYYTRLFGTNSNGTEYVGSEYNGSFHGLLDVNGTLSAVDYPTGGWTSVQAVDNAGDYAGSNCPTGVNQPSPGQVGAGCIGFVHVGSTWIPISYPGAQGTTIYGMNNHGVLVGVYSDQAGVQHGFAYSAKKKKFVAFNVPGATATFLQGINDKLDLVGGYQMSGTSFAFYAVPAK